MKRERKKAWALAVFVTLMLMYVLPELPFALGVLGLAAVCALVFRN